MSRSWSSRWVFACGAAMWMAGACGGGDGDGDGDGASCQDGTERCACYPNGTCNAGLECRSGLCVEGQSTSPSDAGASAEADAGSGVGAANGTGGRSSTTGGRDSSAGRDASAGRASNAGGSGGPTPVETYGALSVVGPDLVDESGKKVKLEGMSSMWLNWEPTGYAESKEGLAWMRDNWDLRVVRAAMGVDAEGAYLEDPEKAKEQVNRIVQNAIDLGVYVIIDWHDHEALSHVSDAIAFFDEMSANWGDHPNVIYEVFNEPLKLDWATQLKPYHQTLVNVIRANDPDNVIVLGTPNWDQDVDVAALSPLSGKNLMYTLHFYACTHRAPEREKARTARSLGLPMFVTEWGATHADGGLDGLVCESEARAWHDFLDQANISWTAWKLDGCTDSSCMFKDRTAPVDGGWTAAHLNGHAPIVIDEMRTGPTGGGATGAGGTGAGGSSGMGASGGGGSGGAPVDPFPPDPEGCKLVTSCPTCCETTGVFALDALSDDATKRYVKSFEVTETSATASFDFLTYDEIGAIFFRFDGPQDIGALGLSVGGTGGSLEVALVRGGGANGCIYPIIGDEISSLPWDCWGNGAGPYVGEPADQIEVRVRSAGSGHAVLSVSDIVYEP